MNKYVVGYLNFFDNEIELHVIEAETAVDAIQTVLTSRESCNTVRESCNTVEELKDWAFNADLAVSVLQIN